jgi:hypothetical protein
MTGSTCQHFLNADRIGLAGKVGLAVWMEMIAESTSQEINGLTS